MEQLSLWITPALVLGLFALVRFMFRDLKDNMNARMNDVTKRIRRTESRLEQAGFQRRTGRFESRMATK